ncbi:hypothetical protein [Paenarthrobacter sp. NPDC091669]|uniref:hypothetical protein n=1 Tax=Paenarthrobacter sp. NPDC091669 TaxID=3364384 RepID=UPI00381013CE
MDRQPDARKTLHEMLGEDTKLGPQAYLEAEIGQDGYSGASRGPLVAQASGYVRNKPACVGDVLAHPEVSHRKQGYQQGRDDIDHRGAGPARGEDDGTGSNNGGHRGGGSNSEEGYGNDAKLVRPEPHGTRRGTGILGTGWGRGLTEFVHEAVLSGMHWRHRHCGG